MEPTIACGRHLAQCADISGSQFIDVNMAACEFNNVNLSRASFHDINLSDIRVNAVQMGGAAFQYVGLPPGSAGKQRPLCFCECDPNGTTFERCDLSNLSIRDCNVTGVTIDGVPLADLLTAYKTRRIE